MKKHFLISITAIFFLISFFSLNLFAQNENAKAIKQNKKYVKMDIGHGGLHCPFLGPKLETAIKNIIGAEDVKMDKVNSWMTFTLPSDNAMTLDELKQVGTKAGYPADDVSVIIDRNPFADSSPK